VLRLSRIALIALTAVLLSAVFATAASAATPGALTQRAGPAGCLTDTATSGCVDARGLSYANSVAALAKARKAKLAVTLQVGSAKTTQTLALTVKR
jgi:hypothetical protein